MQARLDGLVAEKSRWKSQAETLAKKLEDMANANKTEQEKLMDARAKAAVDEFRKTEYEPLTARVKRYEAQMEAENAKLMESVKADLPPDFSEWDISIRNSFLRALHSGKPTPPVGGAPNPSSPAPGRIIPGSTFRAWQSSNMYSPDGRENYERQKADMTAAYTEGRIDWTK